GPLWMAIGLFEVFLFVAGKARSDGARITAELFWVDSSHLSYVLFLPLLLGSVVLVYVLEGTREARRLAVGVILLYVLHGILDHLIGWHAAHPAPGMPSLTGDTLVYFSLPSRVASLVAFAIDVIVILVSYQVLVNRLPRLPLVVPIFCAMVAAMVVDGVVYELLRGRIFAAERLRALEKLQAGIAAGIPLAAYIGFHLRQHRREVRRGILERGAFSILDLRRRVEEVEAMLVKEKEAYRSIRKTFSRYVSAEVVNTLLDDPSRLELGGELRDVTVLFADIRGYSTLAESLEPTEIIDILNRYFEQVTGVILAERGMINEFEGDGVLAVFGAPNDLADHAVRAVRAGIGMLDAVVRLNEEWKRDGTTARWRRCGIDGLAIRIGIHSGPVVAGNIGTHARTKYAVIGDTVNIAARVEGLNKILETQLLLTHSTVVLVSSESDEFAFGQLGTHAVKGRQEAVTVYTVVPNLAAKLAVTAGSTSGVPNA
ncbi:MAG: class 3 adenylate cyclase, partial [Myxococcota bacterium]